MARPPKIEHLSDEDLIKVEALAAVLSRRQIADYFGISYDSWLRLEKRQPEVVQRYKIGKARAISDVANALLMKARKGNTAAAIFYLKTQAGWRETGPTEDTDAQVVFQVHLHQGGKDDAAD